MSISIKFPNSQNVTLEDGESLVILGANGAGKTRFCAKIEELNDARYSTAHTSSDVLIHRISAQKSLTIDETISIHDIDSSEDSLYIGSTNSYANKTSSRFKNNPVTGLLNDFSSALSLLFAENTLQLQIAHAKDVEAHNNNLPRPVPITTIVEKVTAIWNELLPHRKIDLTGNGVHVKLNSSRYHGKEMSDGERVMLYMICQVLVLKPNSVLIIDEPELHIHKAIVNKLWNKLEEYRQDCSFIYVTHDLDFALSRNAERIVWIKNYNGTTWNYDFIRATDFSDLPHELVYEIIGTRQKILFIEGDKNSYDHFLYQEIYRDKGYHVIPCGGCQDVAKYVKSKRAYEKLNSIEVYGIVDRDFRTEAEIAALHNDGIFCLNVAEVENLFVVPELIDIVGLHMGCSDEQIQEAKSFILSLFNQTKEGQIGEAFIKEINHQLSLKKFDDKKLTPTDIKQQLDDSFSEGNITRIYAAMRHKYDSATTIPEVLRIFNFKDLSKKIGSKLGISGNEYPQRVINLIKKNPNGVRGQIINALMPYLPILPEDSALDS